MSAPFLKPAVSEALQRANVFELFAHAFAHPDTGRVTVLRDAARAVLQGDCPLPILRLAVLARETDRNSLEPVYVSLTTLSSSPDCPSYESAYFGGEPQAQTQRMADIAGFYRAFGVDATEGGYRPDDLSVELDFMAFLCRKQAYAEDHLGAPRAGQARKAQRLFLGEHIGRWAPVFAESFASRAPAGHFYAVAGETMAWWLDQEFRKAGIMPEIVTGPVLGGISPASHGPEFAGDAAFIPVESLTGG
ncbi:MAG: molecular chaperone [Dehalococcoidia bacterium]